MERCVLVVEDEVLIRMDAVLMLEEAGLKVVDFDRADDALRYTSDHCEEVAAIFTDVNVRGRMDGLELATIVTSNHPGVTVLVTSGRVDLGPEKMPPRAQFLPKPWLPLQVISALQDAAVH
jgi:two-component system, response regulator PdtaR